MLERALAAIPERESPVGGKRILVAEDQRVVARDIQRSLTALGYSVVDLVPSGQAAIDKARELSPNLVLMDIRMPGPIDGIEAARVVVGELGIPVLYLTAFSDLDTLARAKLSKPLGYLLKPFKEAELRCAIEIALHKHESDAAQGERERLLSSTLRSMGDAVVVTDREERVMLMNRAAERLTGWSSDAASGRKATEVVGLLDRRTGSALESPIARAMREGGATVFEDRVSLGRLDATPIPIEQSAAPIVDDGGRVLGGVVVIRDVSERHKAAEEIRRLHVELEQRVVQRTAQLDAAHKELEAFSYSIAHDLRAPLRGIDGFSKALLDEHGDQLEAGAQGYLRRVRAATQRMGQLIDDLLGLARVSRLEPRRTSVDLSRMARDVGARLARAHPGRAVEFLVQEGAMATCDPGQLRIVLDHLLGNAWKFTSKQPAARIEFGFSSPSSGEDGCDRVFFVRDNGAGFDMAYAGNLFGAFQRLHSPSEFDGTGIGLATVQRVIHRHGGRVWAEAEVGRGATFCFTFSPEGLEPVPDRAITDPR